MSLTRSGSSMPGSWTEDWLLAEAVLLDNRLADTEGVNATTDGLNGLSDGMFL